MKKAFVKYINNILYHYHFYSVSCKAFLSKRFW